MTACGASCPSRVHSRTAGIHPLEPFPSRLKSDCSRSSTHRYEQALRTVDSGARGARRLLRPPYGRNGLGGRRPTWGSVRLQHRFLLPDLGMQREGSMQSHKGICSLVLGSISMGIAMLLGGCSHDPNQPAPVLMMGRNGTTNVAVAAVAPAPAATPTNWWVAGAAPASIAPHPTASPHVSGRPAAARKQLSFAEKARGHRTASHAPTRHRSAKIYSAAAPNLSSTGTIRAPAESIPLDEQPASPAANTAIPAAAASGQTSSAWVSPAPADDSKPAFRPPSP